MQTIKFETIKRRAREELDNRLSMAGGWPGAAEFAALLPAIEMRVDPRELARKWRAEARKVVDGWDVRMVGKLIELFPSCVPARCRGRKMVAYMADDANCTWLVEFI